MREGAAAAAKAPSSTDDAKACGRSEAETSGHPAVTRRRAPNSACLRLRSQIFEHVVEPVTGGNGVDLATELAIFVLCLGRADGVTKIGAPGEQPLPARASPRAAAVERRRQASAA